VAKAAPGGKGPLIGVLAVVGVLAVGFAAWKFMGSDEPAATQVVEPRPKKEKPVKVEEKPKERAGRPAADSSGVRRERSESTDSSDADKDRSRTKEKKKTDEKVRPPGLIEPGGDIG